MSVFLLLFWFVFQEGLLVVFCFCFFFKLRLSRLVFKELYFVWKNLFVNDLQ